MMSLAPIPPIKQDDGQTMMLDGKNEQPTSTSSPDGTAPKWNTWTKSLNEGQGRPCAFCQNPAIFVLAKNIAEEILAARIVCEGVGA